MATLTNTQRRQLSQIKQPSRIIIEVSDEAAVATAANVEASFDDDGNNG